MTRYSITDLGNPGGGDSIAYDLNRQGQVVGQADTPDKDKYGHAIKHAFLWERGHITDLGTFADVPNKQYRRQNSLALAINDAGQVVGQAADNQGQRWPCLWQPGQVVRLGTLGGKNGEACGISEQGMVVGASGTDLEGGWTHAFLYRSGKMLDLGTLGGNLSHAYAVNDAGQVVGMSATVGNKIVQGFLWEHGRMQGLGTRPDFMPTATWAVNSRGEAVGVAQSQESTSLPAVSRTGAAYAIRAAQAAAPEGEREQAGRRECRWQREQLPDEIRELVRDDQRLRNPACWFVFDGGPAGDETLP